MISRKYLYSTGKRFLNIYFLRFLDVSAADADELLTALIPVPEGGGEVLFGVGLGSSLPHRLDGLLGPPEHGPANRVDAR